MADLVRGDLASLGEQSRDVNVRQSRVTAVVNQTARALAALQEGVSFARRDLPP